MTILVTEADLPHPTGVHGVLTDAAFLVPGAAAIGLSYHLLRGGGDSVLWKGLVVVGVALLLRGAWEWVEIDGRLALSLVIFLGALNIGICAWDSRFVGQIDTLGTRGRAFLGLAVLAAIYAGVRLRAIASPDATDCLPQLLRSAAADRRAGFARTRRRAGLLANHVPTDEACLKSELPT